MQTQVLAKNEFLTTVNNVNLDKLVGVLEGQKIAKLDLVAPSSKLGYYNNHLIIDGVSTGMGESTGEMSYAINNTATSQLLEKIGVPRQYWNRMQEQNPSLAELTVNSWFSAFAKKSKSPNYFIRTFAGVGGDGNGLCRAFLSDHYAPIDNYDVLLVALEAVQAEAIKNKIDIRIDACDISETKMYVRFVCPEIEVQSRALLENYQNPGNGEKGLGICTGFVLSNSEVGFGSFVAAPRLMVNACKNGMVWYDEAYKRNHLGAKLDEGIFNWSNETKSKNLALIISQIKDVVTKYITPEYLGQKVKELENVGLQKIENPFIAVKNVCNDLGISSERAQSVLEFFTKGGRVGTAFDIAQAITYAAHSAGADNRWEYETKILNILPKIKNYDTPKEIKRSAEN